MEDSSRPASGGVECSSLLFEKAIPVRIKALAEDRDAELTIRIIIGLSKNRRSSKVLQVQITNELDPFFLYFLEVSEEDFQSLKVDQCILVDFGAFPHKFIELLEHCLRAGSAEAPRFLAVLNIRTGDSTFSVVETNQFKHLSHLSLCFRQGNDSTIKAYLAGRLAEYKTANSDLHEKLRRTIESLENSIKDVHKLRSELGEFKDLHCRTLSDLRAQHTLELAKEKEKAMQECSELRSKLESERLDLEHQLRQKVAVQEDRVAELERQLRESAASVSSLEQTLAELKTKLAAVSKDFQLKEEDCGALRENNRAVNEELQHVSKQLNDTRVRLAAAELEVQSKNELVTTISRQLETLSSQRSALELALKDAQTAAERGEEKAAASLVEANNYKQIIEKLQAEVKSSKAKVKLKGQVAAQQDRLLHEREATVEKSTAENNTLKQELADLKAKVEALKQEADESRRKYDESQESLKSHQQMVQWLNQQLTDTQLGKFTFSSSRYRPVSEHSKGLGLSSFSRANSLLLPSASSMSSRSGRPCYSPPVSKVSYKPATPVQAEAKKAEEVKNARNLGNGADGRVSADEGKSFTVEWKRSGMPDAQLSFARREITPMSS